MFYETGCYGRVVLGKVSGPTASRLAALPGDWLEFDPAANEIAVRHVQPSSAPCLPTIAAELVRMLAELQAAEQDAVAGGDLFLHTEDTGQLVRLRVEAGGAVRIDWAHPDYQRAMRSAYRGVSDCRIPGAVHRLNGCVTFNASAARAASAEIQALADNFDGLYPEGEFIVLADEAHGAVQLRMTDLNLDVHALIACLQRAAEPGTLFGRIEVSSFASVAPERNARFLFEDGVVSVQHPVLWEDRALAREEAIAR